MNATIVHTGTPAHRHTGQRAANRLGQPTGSLTFLHWSHGTAKPNSNVITMAADRSGRNPVRQVGLLVILRRMMQICLGQLVWP